MHIKLVLKLADVEHLMFTNRNGMKALQKSYEEFAYLMSSGVVRHLNVDTSFSASLVEFFAEVQDTYKQEQSRGKMCGSSRNRAKLPGSKHLPRQTRFARPQTPPPVSGHGNRRSWPPAKHKRPNAQAPFAIR